MTKMKRQAATPNGFERRIRDLHFERVPDPRYAPNVDYQLSVMLTVLVTAMVTKAKSLRDAELRTGQLVKHNGPWQGLHNRIADNTFGNVIGRLEQDALVKRLVGMVKAEHRRGNLEPTVLPIRTAAIDGKNVATLRWHDLCRVLDLDPNTANPKQVKKRLKKEFPNVQLCIPEEGQPYALARVHTVTLISSQAANCIYQRPIEGCTNEIGAMPALLKELRAAYGRTEIVAMLTTDAGNTSLDTATMTVEKLRWHYFAQIKSTHGEIHKEAVRVLGNRRTRTADDTYEDTQNGDDVTYHVWCEDLSEHGWLDWTHARQLVRVQRVAVNRTTGKTSTGNRYYVTSVCPSALNPKDCLTISRGHWRCEEETHWTTDVVLQEDRRRLAWSRHPQGVFVVSTLRMMALNILAVARKLSRLTYTEETPTWHQVAEHFLLVLCATILVTEEFDDVSE